MGWVRDFLKKLTSEDKSSERFVVDIDRDGINLVLPLESFDACVEGEGSVWALHQYVFLQMLEEQGLAERIRNGFAIPAAAAASMEEEAMVLLDLPHRFPGRYKTRIRGQTGEPEFTVQIIPLLPTGIKVQAWELRGACLQFSADEQYLLQATEQRAFRALLNHGQIPDDARSEQLDLKLVGALQFAKEDGMDIDLEHFNRLDVTEPHSVGVAGRQTEDGGLLLTPTLGAGMDPNDIERRLGQIPLDSEIATMHVGDQIILLDEDRLRAVHEIITNRVIPADQVKAFMEAPGAFLDATLVDLDTGFSLCVKGAGQFTHLPIGETDASGIDWFNLEQGRSSEALHQLIETTEELVAFKTALALAREQGAQSLVYSGHHIDISEPDQIDRVLTEISDRIGEHDEAVFPTESTKQDAPFGERATVLVEEDETENIPLFGFEYKGPLDFSLYRRSPYPYQEEGVRWFLGLAESAMRGDDSVPAPVQGALLADDMGLGKTYMALVGISEIYSNLQQRGETAKPVLVVAPLSLLENWEEEIGKTFKISPFDDIVALQAGRDLPRYRIQGAGSETKQDLQGGEVLPEDAIRYSLKVGSKFGLDRLDIPKRLVLTTYQTLRDYQFSLCRVGWSVVVFDEAQNVKNPNVLQTRAARGLNANFKLLMTGTPVENSLVDFWCLMRIAQPNLLGEIDQFRAEYIRPIKQAEPAAEEATRLEVGKRLRTTVGAFLLRRMKEDHLVGLPAKRVYCGVADEADGRLFCPPIGTQMSGKQMDRYDTVIENYQGRSAGGDGRGQALSTLQHLRDVSLHPELYEGEFVLPQSPSETLAFLQQSAKISGVIKLIDEIKNREEKVIVFLIHRRLQRLFKIALESHYGVSVSIINGDTKAVTSSRSTETRKSLIECFEAKPGFGVILMSPVAAGVGLTVVGANNVIHLERHWNPAKEAQATDRVYRIGQELEVNVYLPILHHPDRVSFDLNLDRLLRRKSGLKDAVVTPQTVQPREMQEVFPAENRDTFVRATDTRLSYKQYLRSALWASLRTEAIDVAHTKCAFCQSQDRLQVHHKRYPSDFRDDSIDNLVVVCDTHHKTLHGLRMCDMCHGWHVLKSWQPKPPRDKARVDVVPMLDLCERCFEKASVDR